MGCTVRIGERKTTIPAIQQGSALEWSVTARHQEVSTLEKPVVGIVQGHGSLTPGIEPVGPELSVMYRSATAIFDSVPIHERFQALVFVGPTVPYAPCNWTACTIFSLGAGVVIAYDAVHDLGSTLSPICATPAWNLGWKGMACVSTVHHR